MMDFAITHSGVITWCDHRSPKTVSAETGNVVIYHLKSGGHAIFEQAASKLTTSLLWIVFLFSCWSLQFVCYF